MMMMIIIIIIIIVTAIVIITIIIIIIIIIMHWLVWPRLTSLVVRKFAHGQTTCSNKEQFCVNAYGTQKS